MAKKLTKSKARKILHDKEVHGHPLTEQQRKFFGAIAGGAEPYKAQAGVKTCPPGFVNIEGKCFDKASDEYKALYKYGIGYMDDEDTLVSSRMELPEVVLKPKSVLDFLDKINLGTDATYGGGANRYAFDQLGKKYGFIPNVKILKEKQPSELENLLFDIFDSSDKKRTFGKTAHYIPFTKTAYVDNIKDYIAELSHHVDPLVDNLGMFLITDLPAIIKQQDRYKTKGTSEYRAHEEIQPKLKKDFEKYKREYWDNVFRPRYMDTNDPLLRQERMDDVWNNYVSPVKKKKDGGWLDKFDAPQAQNGIEGTMGGLTDAGFNYNGAWGGPSMQDGGILQPPMAGANTSVSMAQLGDSVKPIPMQLAMGGSMPGAVGFMYARTQNPAPANGPYAKKTKASAQDGDSVTKGKEFLTKMAKSPLFGERYATMTNRPLEQIDPKEIEDYRGRVLKNLETVKIAAPGEEPEPNFWESHMLLGGMYLPSQHRLYVNEMYNTPGTVTHELSHSTTKGREDLPFSARPFDYVSSKQEPGLQDEDTREYLTTPTEIKARRDAVAQMAMEKGIWNPTTEKFTEKHYDQLKAIEKELSEKIDKNIRVDTKLIDAFGQFRDITIPYSKEEAIRIFNSFVKGKGKEAPVAQNGQEMKYYQEGLDFKPKTISKNGGWLDKYEKAQTGVRTGPDPFVTARAMSALREFAQQNTPVPTAAKPAISPLALKQRDAYMSGVGGDMINYPQQIAKEQQKKVNIKAAEKILEQKRAQEAAPKPTFLSADNRSELEREEAQRRTQEILWRQHLQNHPFVRTMASGTPGGNPAVGLIGAENTRDLITGVPQSASNLVRFATGQNVYGDNTFDKVTGVGLDLLSVGAGAASMVPGKQISNVSKLRQVPPQASAQVPSSSLIKPFLKFELDDALASSFKDFRLGINMGLGELGTKSKRPLSEIFPITKAQRQKAVDVAKQAHAEGDAFARSWFYDPAGNIRPDVEGKIIDILRSKGSPLEGSRYYPNYKTLNDLRYTINTPTGPSYFFTQNPVGETKSVLLGSSMKSINKASGNTAYAPHKWKYPLTANRDLYPLDPDEARAILEEKHTIGGVNFGKTDYAGPSVTLMGHGPYYYHPNYIRHLASHEMGHTLQNIGATKAGAGGFPGDFTSWRDVITSPGKDFGYEYYVPNFNTELGNRFAAAMVPPIKGKKVWASAPSELHSDLMGARANVHKELMNRGMSFEDAMQAVKDQTMTDDAMVDKLIRTGNLNKFFKPNTPIEEKRALIRMLPATITGLGAASAIGASSQEVPQQQDGGEIPVDPMGYWNPENVGNPVIIPSNIITMEGVDQPLIGISDTGDIQYMEPGEDYEFDGEYVTEYPVAQDGIRTLPNVTVKDKKKPIIVSNPNDPRLKAYQDSLAVYNSSKFIKEHPLTGNYIPGKEDERQVNINIDKKNVKKYNPKFATTYTGYYWDYKKPVQPVEYRKPEDRRDTLYVPDINDPRLKAYQDSLDLYKRFPLPPIGYKISPYVFQKTAGFVVGQDSRGNDIIEKRPNTKPKIEPIGYTRHNAGERGTTYNLNEGKYEDYFDSERPVYKKPVQPVVYRPEPEYKPRPRIEAELPRTSIGDLSYNLPKAPAQPSKTKKTVTRKDEPERTKKTPVKDFLEDMRLRMEDRKMERKTKRGIKSQLKCFSGVCYDNEGNIVQAKDGVSVNNADAQPLKKLNQLLNFTNYNKPTKGGWLDKYN